MLFFFVVLHHRCLGNQCRAVVIATVNKMGILVVMITTVIKRKENQYYSCVQSVRYIIFIKNYILRDSFSAKLRITLKNMRAGCKNNINPNMNRT